MRVMPERKGATYRDQEEGDALTVEEEAATTQYQAATAEAATTAVAEDENT